jgi:hypothetical protein
MLKGFSSKVKEKKKKENRGKRNDVKGYIEWLLGKS